MKQRGIIHYGLSPNRQRPLAGAFHAAIFNTWRRAKGQVLYVVPPFVVAYLAMSWAIKRCVQCHISVQGLTWALSTPRRAV